MCACRPSPVTTNPPFNCGYILCVLVLFTFQGEIVTPPTLMAYAHKWLTVRSCLLQWALLSSITQDYIRILVAVISPEIPEEGGYFEAALIDLTAEE